MGRLIIKNSPFRYTRFAEAIEARAGTLPQLANAFAVDAEPHAHEKPLMQVYCPKCGSQRTSKGLQLQRVTNFANLKCQLCGDTSNTKDWACGCGLKWRKCPRHIFVEAPSRSVLPKRPKRTDPRGSEAPPPKHRRIETDNLEFSVNERRVVRIALPPHGKLAERFPHLVQTVAADQIVHFKMLKGMVAISRRVFI